MKKIFTLAFAFCLLCVPSFASEKQKNASAKFLYAPEYCEFQIEFPQEYFSRKSCIADNCFDIISFAKTNENSNVDVRLSCQKKTSEEIKDIKNSDLKETVRELAIDAGLRPYAADVATLPSDIVTAVTIALGMRGKKESIYTGQFWIGKKSLLTLEAEMTGPANTEIEKIYSEILTSVKPKEKSPQ